MVKQGYRRSSWSQRHYWRGVPTTRWSRRRASPENLLDHVMFPPCHRIARLFDRVEDLGYRTVDQLVYERLRCPTASAYSSERSSLLETRSVLAEANAFWILTQGRPTSYPGTFRPTTRHVRASARIGHCCAAERRSSLRTLHRYYSKPTPVGEVPISHPCRYEGILGGRSCAASPSRE
jgi:hypothetical protein